MARSRTASVAARSVTAAPATKLVGKARGLRTLAVGPRAGAGVDLEDVHDEFTLPKRLSGGRSSSDDSNVLTTHAHRKPMDCTSLFREWNDRIFQLSPESARPRTQIPRANELLRRAMPPKRRFMPASCRFMPSAGRGCPIVPRLSRIPTPEAIGERGVRCSPFSVQERVPMAAARHATERRPCWPHSQPAAAGAGATPPPRRRRPAPTTSPTSTPSPTPAPPTRASRRRASARPSRPTRRASAASRASLRRDRGPPHGHRPGLGRAASVDLLRRLCGGRRREPAPRHLRAERRPGRQPGRPAHRLVCAATRRHQCAQPGRAVLADARRQPGDLAGQDRPRVPRRGRHRLVGSDRAEHQCEPARRGSGRRHLPRLHHPLARDEPAHRIAGLPARPLLRHGARRDAREPAAAGRREPARRRAGIGDPRFQPQLRHLRRGEFHRVVRGIAAVVRGDRGLPRSRAAGTDGPGRLPGLRARLRRH